MAKLTPKTWSQRAGALIAATALIALPACKPKPKDLPPPPGPEVGTAPGPVTDPNAGYGSDAAAANRARFQRETQGDTVLFALDQSDIDATARPILDSQAQWLAGNPAVNVTIEGHADERGTREYNLALGDRRANAAKNYLVTRGVNAARINTISYGKERPVKTGSDQESWAENRRAVTVTVN